MREEFKRLEELLSYEGEITPEKGNEILKEAVGLFEKLKTVVVSGTQEEKDEMIRFMTKINELIKKQFLAALKASGLTEEQFAQLNENPQLFTKEQWERMQQTKQALAEKGRELSKTIVKAEEFIRKQTAGQQGAIQPPSQKETKSSSSGLRPKRKNWLKS